MTAILGIDVSSCQVEPFPWADAQSRDGIVFAVCKATDGQSVDSRFLDHVTAARRAGIVTGSYHVLNPEKNAVDQAARYHRIAGGMTEMPPAVDWELPQYQDQVTRVGAGKIVTAAEQFVEETEALWGRPCLVYTYPWFIHMIGDRYSEILAHCPLWMASYPPDRPTMTADQVTSYADAMWLPSPWRGRSKVAICQFDGDKGRKLKCGIDVDFNWMRSREDLDELCAMKKESC